MEEPPIVPVPDNQPEAETQPTSKLPKNALLMGGGLLIVVLVVVAVIAPWNGGAVKPNESPSPSASATASATASADAARQSNNLGSVTSLDPATKGRALGNGQCTGTGSTKLTHAPMDMKDVETIQPMGLMVGAHVTPVDHEYYYQKDFNAPKDTYPVYATMDGTIVGVEHTGNAWFVVLSHSCTFYQQYNLMTSFEKTLESQLPAGWGPNSNGGVSIPVKAGQIVGYVGGQSLDLSVWDTEKNLTGFLNPIAYNNREPWKVNTVRPLDYFTDAVKAEVLTKYVRTVEPRDGKIDNDVKGQAIGNWFVEGTNGYAGGDKGDGSTVEQLGHLALAYDYIDAKSPEFSIGDYQGQPAQFAVKGAVDYSKITQASGLVKLELGQLNWITGDGSKWTGQFATGITVQAGPTKATALIQLTGDETMKVEVFPNKTPDQVTAFTSAAKTYNRGQDAHLIVSSTAH
jgi:hypothetical protein